MLIAPSMLSSDFAKLGEEIKRIETAGADWIHLDVMDGHFVPNLTFGAPVIAAMRPYTRLPFDVHLMLENPLRYIPDFAKAGADIVSFHVESASDPARTIAAIREAGMKPALAVKPGTPIDAVLPYLPELFMVLVMTVEPGFGGQRFRPEMMEKVKAVKRLARADSAGANQDPLVEIDGGVDRETVRLAVQAGVDACVAGTSVFRAPDAAEAIAALKRCAVCPPLV